MEDVIKDAICFGRVDEVEEWLDNGVDPNSKDESGNTLLHWAVNTKEIGCLQLLVQHGADPNLADENGNTPLHAAVANESDNVVKLLIELGANYNAKNAKKKTPLDIAKKPLADKIKQWSKEKESSQKSPPLSARANSVSSPPAVTEPPSKTKPAAEKDKDKRSSKKPSKEAEPVVAPESSQNSLLPPMSPALLDDEHKAKLRKLLQREEALMLREQDINRRATELEAVKAREKDLEAKLEQFEKDQQKLRAQVESHNEEVLAAAMPLISASSAKLKEKIGEGAFATIYKGSWRGTSVAVKVANRHDEGPLTGKYTDADVADVFFRELKILSKLRHPNIMMVMAACLDPQKRLFVMELCDTDMFALLHSSAELSISARIGMAIDAAASINFLHSSKPPILHRDIKSSNFLVDQHGGIKLTDFGLCVTKGVDHAYGFTSQSAVDDANKGTPAYMAPECLKTESFDEKADVWSFGVVLWELITRKIPWEGMEPTRIYAEVTTGTRLTFPENHGFPDEYTQLVRQCWVENPKERPSFSSIVKQLKRAKKAAKAK